VDGDCAVITPIGLDHQEYLGSDLVGIGREKAGIIRPGRPVICGEAHPPSSVLEVAAALHAPVKRFDVEFTVHAVEDGLRFRAGGRTLVLPPPALPGPHQVANLATAVAALLELVPEAAREPQALARGLRSTSLPGRFERLSEHPAVWIDVGHNPLGAQALQRTLREQLSGGPIRRCRCVLGMLVDKDAAGVADALRDVISAWYCAPTAGARGQSAEDLAGRISARVGAAPVRLFGSVAAALDAAVADSAPDEGVLVFGSFLTAAAAGLHWRGRTAGLLCC
jgi:dihydrofolate synthase/folylpolyglutamate synthase